MPLEDACKQCFTHSLRLWCLVIDLVDLEVAVEEHSQLLEAMVVRDGAPG